MELAVGISASERLAAGLTLHRSMVHAKREATQTGLKASGRARGRYEGFHSTGSKPFKALGAPVFNGPPIPAEPSRPPAHSSDDWPLRLQVDRAREWDHRDNEDEESSPELSRLKRADDLSRGLFSEGLVPRHRSRQSGPQPGDDIYMLRGFIRDSESRLQHVKTQSLGKVQPLVDDASLLEKFMPPRERYPPIEPLTDRRHRAGARSEDRGRALQSAGALTARGPPRQAMWDTGAIRNAEARLLALGLGLPTLAEYLADPRSLGSLGGSSGEAYRRASLTGASAGDKLTSPRADLPHEGGRAGKKAMDVRRKLEKQLNESVQKEFWKRCLAVPAAVDEARRRAEEGREEGAGGGAESPGPGGAEEQQGPAQEVAQRRNRRSRHDPEEVTLSDKALQMMKDVDPNTAPVARLRGTLRNYQAAREFYKDSLREKLQHMDVARLKGHAAMQTGVPVEVTAAPDAPPEPTTWSQHKLYKELLSSIELDRREPPPVAHFIFDFLWKVVMNGEEFSASMFWAMLERIQNYEFSSFIAGIVVRLVEGVRGVTLHGIVDWFKKNRDEVPASFREHVRDLMPVAPSTPGTPRLSKGGGLVASGTMTFVTQEA